MLRFTLPAMVLLGVLSIWYFVSWSNLFPGYALPSPMAVMKSFREEMFAGRLINDIIASLWRVAVGFVISAVLGIPAGLWLGQHIHARQAFLPMLNFFRFLSPLAWIPFAILWFHIGDKPAFFLISASLLEQRVERDGKEAAEEADEDQVDCGQHERMR